MLYSYNTETSAYKNNWIGHKAAEFPSWYYIILTNLGTGHHILYQISLFPTFWIPTVKLQVASTWLIVLCIYAMRKRSTHFEEDYLFSVPSLMFQYVLEMGIQMRKRLQAQGRPSKKNWGIKLAIEKVAF